MTTVTIVEQRNAVTVEEGVVHVTPVEQETAVTVALGGVTDHGALSGLADDDHAQYLTTARHAAIGDNPHGVTAVDVGALPLSGGTMTGALILDADPSAALEAATKQYVDNNAGGASDVDDLTTDTGNAGEMVRVAAAGGLEYRSTAQVLSDIGAAAAADLADYLPLAGGTLTGVLFIPSNSTTPQIRAAGASGAGIAMDSSGNVTLFGGSSGQRNISLSGNGLNLSGIPRLLVPPGTVSVPGLGWSNDGDTGFFRTFDGGGATGMTSDATEIARVTQAGFKVFKGLLPTIADAVTNAITNIATLGHNSTGTPAAGFGAGLLYQLESSTTENRDAARIAAVWETATDASRKADLVLSAYDTAEREFLRGRGNGSAAAIGFLGATPAVRQSHIADPSGGTTEDAEARAAINSILSVLETFGLVATS